ncbi:MAG: flippase [Gemmatimonadetes bacterium]|nr:MAG: flippase [Gemmatimonadota bacterium]
MSRKLLQNTSFLAISNISKSGLSLVKMILLARFLGDVGMGQYTLITTLVMQFTVLIGFGLNTLFIRDVAATPEHARTYFQHVLRIRAVLTLLSILGLVAFIGFAAEKSADIKWGLALSCLWLISLSLNYTLDALFRAFQRMDILMVINIGQSVLEVGGIFGALWQGHDLVMVIGIIVLVDSLKAIISLIWGIPLIAAKHPVETGSVLSIFRAALIFALIGIVGILYARIDVIMLSMLAGDKPVGLYAIALAILTAVRLVPNAFFGAVFPLIAEQPGRKIAQRLYPYLFLSGSGLALLVTLLAEKFIRLAFGVEFTGATRPAQILIWTLPFLMVNAVMISDLYAHHRQRLVLGGMTVGLVFNILTNWLFIPRYSLYAATVTTVLSEIVLMCCFVPFLRQST